jgi:predicted Zn-dependent peptidase/class 3 adenylate cyclase
MRCSSCGRDNPDDANFCGGCATALGDVREERKVVTVLFADLVGSTARAETMDPEDVRARLSRYYSHVRGELEGFGGKVEKFIGDAVVAVFGAPVAHEDDPERAVRAALAVRDWAAEQPDIDVRVGINTGETLVTLGAETLVAGDVVNTGDRLQAAAPTNGILVGETTYQATRHAIDFREVAPIEAKGKTGPISVWEVLAPLVPLGAERWGEFRTPFVGRERQLDALRAVVERARHERAPQLITLVGLPGIGKSRLVYELSQIVRAELALVSWRQGRCLAYGDGLTFWALGEIVKAHAGILESDAQEAAERKIDQALDVVPLEERDWIKGQLHLLVGLGAQSDLGGDRRAEAFAAWRRFIECLASARELVLVFEDLHWADDGLLDFIEYLVEWAEDAPILCLCTARPEFLERRPAWGSSLDRARRIALSPLRDDETMRLLRSLLGAMELDEAQEDELLERAGGNPLYAEQFVRMLHEHGDSDGLRAPETLQGLVAARIDLLPEEEKTLLQDASVIGKVVWTGALASVSGGNRFAVEERMRSLERKGFLGRRTDTSIAGEHEWAFTHALLREVAYAEIPRAERAVRHEVVARWIENLARQDDHAELIAHHYLAAFELCRAAGLETEEQRGHARLSARRAGDRASRLNAFATAAAHYETAVSLSPTDHPERAQLLFRLAYALHFAGAETSRDSVQDAPEAVRLGDPESDAEGAVFRALAAWHRGQRDAAFGHLERAFGAGPIFEKTTLENGIRVVTAPMPQVGSVACFVMVAAGSRYETRETNGIAHFAEHMFFKGTERRPRARDIATEIDGIGGEFNAFTGKEYTGFYVKCAADERAAAFDVLVDMIRNSTFESGEIEREKGVIVEEMNMYYDTPRDFIGDQYERLLYGDQPLGWDIIGSKDTVRAATREMFMDYLSRWYKPERMVVGVAGRIGEDLHIRLEELLGDLRPEPTPVPDPVVLSEDDSASVLLRTKQSDQAHICLGVRSYPLVHPDRYVVQLVTTVLGGGMSSRLFTEVRERRSLAYYVFGMNKTYTDAGSLYAQAGVDITRIDKAVETIVWELRRIAEEPVPSDELEKARNSAKGRFVLQLETPHETIGYGLRQELLENDIEEPDEVLRHLDEVTAEDVQRVAHDLIKGRRMYLAATGPFDDPERFERLLAP